MYVELHAFGALSEKPLLLKGSWPGAKYLKEVYDGLKVETANREKVEISKPVGPILDCIMTSVVWSYLLVIRVWFVSVALMIMVGSL